MKRLIVLLGILGAFGAPPSPAADKAIDKVVKKVEARFEPATARPGQVVTLKVEVKLDDGWHTYPTLQEDKGAKAQDTCLSELMPSCPP